MASIRFFVKADRKLDNTYSYRDHFQIGGRVGHVDEDVAKENPAAYAAWKQYADANRETLNAAARDYADGKATELPSFKAASGVRGPDKGEPGETIVLKDVEESEVKTTVDERTKVSGDVSNPPESAGKPDEKVNDKDEEK